MNLSKQRLTQLLIFAQIENDIQTKEYNNMLAHYMPEIVLNKKEKDIEIWKDIIDIINFFLEAETDFVQKWLQKNWKTIWLIAHRIILKVNTKLLMLSRIG